MNSNTYIVYKTTNLVNGKIYVGVHSKPNDDYLGSGLAINRAIKKHGRENFKREILIGNLSEDEAFEIEELFVDDEFLSRGNNAVYNISCGGKGGHIATPYKDQHGNTVIVYRGENKPDGIVGISTGRALYRYPDGTVKSLYSDHYDVTSGYCILNNCGTVSAKSTVTGVTRRISTTSEEWTSGEYVSTSKGKMNVVLDGKVTQVSCDDSRLISGELKSNQDGFGTYRDVNSGICYRLHKSDLKLSSGIYEPNNKGRVVIIDENGNRKSIETTDPDYISGKYKMHISGKCTFVDLQGKRYFCFPYDPIIEELNLKSITTGTLSVTDKDGNRQRVSITDPRVISGELVSSNKGKIAIHHKLNRINKRIDPKDLNLYLTSGWIRGRSKRNWS